MNKEEVSLLTELASRYWRKPEGNDDIASKDFINPFALASDGLRQFMEFVFDRNIDDWEGIIKSDAAIFVRVHITERPDPLNNFQPEPGTDILKRRHELRISKSFKLFLGLLARENGEANHIYARIQRKDAFVVDDLTEGALQRLSDLDIKPDLLIKTSWESYQGIFLSEKLVSQDFDSIKKVRAKFHTQFGTDGTNPVRHLGVRVPGYANLKGKHVRKGKLFIAGIVSQGPKNPSPGFDSWLNDALKR